MRGVFPQQTGGDNFGQKRDRKRTQGDSREDGRSIDGHQCGFKRPCKKTGRD